MIVNSEFEFEASVSLDAYADKKISGAMIGSGKDENNRIIRKQYGFKANVGIGYKRVTTTPKQLYDDLTNGHVLCHLFEPKNIRKDGTFGSSEKKDDNFIGSYVVCVDIDHTSYNNVEEFVNKLSLKPTFYYTSYSNKQLDENGNSKGARFRLIYVFDELIQGKYNFRYAAWKINKLVERDTNEEISDDCNLKCSQYFNGTNKSTNGIVFSSGFTGNIYSGDDLDANLDDYIDFLNHNAYYKTKTADRTKEINTILNNINSTFNNSSSSTTYYNETENSENNTIQVEEPINTENSLYSKELLNDMSRLDYDEFMKYNRHKYHYFWRVEKEEWINNLYQVVDDNYFAFTYSFGRNAIKHDGQHRRKTVFMRMCLRRVMNPEVDADTILFNAYEDIHRFFDWSGLDLGGYLERNIEHCFNKTIEEIENDYADVIKHLKEVTKPKRGIIYKSKKLHTKETTFLILDDIYNRELSVKENIELLEVLGYPFKKTTIYEYLKNRKQMGIIYKYTSPSGKVYIGQTVNPELRREAFNTLSRDYGGDKINNARKKYGTHNFIYEVIEECDASLLDEREIYWIAYYDSYKNGYNSTKGGKILPDDALDKAHKTVSINKEIKKEVILNNYDNTKSVKDNLQYLNEIGIKIKSTTLYSLLKENGIISDCNKLTDDEIISIIDINLSANKNLEILKDSGIKIGNKRLNKLYKIAS